MGQGTGLLLWLVFTAVTLYALFFMIRAGVEAGIRRALPDARLRRFSADGPPPTP